MNANFDSMNARFKLSVCCRSLIIATLIAATGTTSGQEPRAKPPKFSKDQFRGIFFDDPSDALSGKRPKITDMKQQSAVVAGGNTANSNTASSSGAGSAKGKWLPLADAVNLEDEVKRIKLHYDELVTTPGRFKGGEFQAARTDLALLAMLFAVISEYEGEVRFKKDAALARDLMARSAVRVTTGSAETFDEAKARKADLQDLVSGTGLNRAAPTEATDWSVVTTRSPLMEYLEIVLDDPLQSGTNDADSVSDSMDDLKRTAGIVAVIAEVLNQEGMEGADDADYRAFAEEMKQAALQLRSALQQNDANAARLAVGELSQSCDKCHESYR